ncbi:MAG: phosphoribosylformylglycinamidine synthase subunit PurS [Bacteroidetes bacterium]|nr:phosphoribosylformylglycinamidine synthase subunit PurS [Bacteroidota bacterium]MBM3424027.1 phosphoribosylformylglycinamidine synthase subunit PurS [Bacteroidota bacterium]
MKFKAEIDVMPHEALLDPQGKAVTQAMGTIGLNEIQDVRIGRHIRLYVEAKDETNAKAKVEEACQKMLANAIMESYYFSIQAV